MRRKKLLAFALIALVLTGCTQVQAPDSSGALPTLTVTYLDVGKADCILLETDGHAAMIDTGDNGDADDILAALSSKNITSLDFLLLTHMDKDHIGGADALIENIEIGTVYAPNYVKEGKQYDQYLAALDAAGIAPVAPTEPLELSFGQGVFTLLPAAQQEYDQSNDYSIMSTLVHGETSFLFAGDAETVRLTEFVTGAFTPCDVLKVPHHGNRDAMTLEFMTLVTPKYAVITCNEKNPPDQAVVDFLASLGTQVFKTMDGTVVITSDGKQITAP